MRPEDQKKIIQPLLKSELHERNLHRNGYDFERLVKISPELKKHIQKTKSGQESINFSDPFAVKLLNRALLLDTYHLKDWTIPEGYLCPPVPGRADYLHYAADLLASDNNGVIPKGSSVNVLDIGTGASCIFPLLGHSIYGWNFIASDCDKITLESAKKNCTMNRLNQSINIRHQPNVRHIFFGIIQNKERFDLTICNPPFHASEAESMQATLRKTRNLTKKKIENPVLNFGGKHHELVFEGGELRFIRNMIFESKHFADSCLWFTTLVSKESNLKSLYNNLKQAGALTVKTIDMAQGQKKSRLLVWTFQSETQRLAWNQNRNQTTK